MRARERCALQPDGAPVTNAPSPLARSACFPHPVQRKERGWSVAAQEAPVEIYNDEMSYTYRLDLPRTVNVGM